MKPELRTSLVVAEWPREVRYFWVLLWGYVDDFGRGVDDARLVKADCLPLDDDITRATIDDWLKLIAAAGPLCRYEVDGKRYLHVPSWSEHQRPQHPKPTKIPPCPFHDHGEPSGDLHDNFTNPSGEPPEDFIPEMEQGDGGGEGEGTDSLRSSARGERATKPRARATRLPDDFAVTAAMVTWARERVPGVDGRHETEKFINHWRAKPGKDGTKIDWAATWRNWMLNASERTPANGRASPSNGIAVPGAQRPSTTDQRVNAGLAVVAHFEAQEQP